MPPMMISLYVMLSIRDSFIYGFVFIALFILQQFVQHLVDPSVCRDQVFRQIYFVFVLSVLNKAVNLIC